MQKEVKVSVILPIYNAGANLRSCIDTLLCQTLREIEIICVLDCPTDGSGEIVKEYSRKDDRIVVIENKASCHIGVSRNIGISVARGEYIGFSDHDDWRELDMYEKLYDKAKKENADICLSDFSFSYPSREVVYRYPLRTTSEEVFKSLIQLKPIEKNKRWIGNIRSVWTNIYRTSFVREHSMAFVDTRSYSYEDELFCTLFFSYMPSMCYVSETFYHWRQYEESTSHKKEYKSFDNVVRTLDYKYEVLQSRGYVDRYSKELFIGCVRRLYTLANQLRLNVSNCKVREQINGSDTIKKLMTYYRFRYLFSLPLTKTLFFFRYLRNG